MADTPQMPALPEVDLRMQIPYESIRYIAGFHEGYVKQYAVAYAKAVLDRAYGAMFAVKGDKATLFDAQTAIRKLAAEIQPPQKADT